PIVINRDEDGNFFALDSFCPHAGCFVGVFDPFFGVMLCPCHGSSYDIDGSIVTGPTVSPLRRFDIAFDGQETLTITVPGLGYSVQGSVVADAECGRFRLMFPTFPFAEYEVRFRATLNTTWATVPFALSLDGPADQMTLTGDGQEATVFVPISGATGFYAATIKIMEITF
ncbi:MAG TPA: Rieske (2Fe-2S) protein, partial [Verrucomicrobiae bacterium]